MYPDQTEEGRAEKIKEIQDATIRTIQDENNKALNQALTIAWKEGWQACLEAHGLMDRQKPGIKP